MTDPSATRSWVPAAAREAATVLLARDAAEGVEILLVERHLQSKMAGGAFAFPGGRLEPADAAPGAERLCRGLTVAGAAARLSDVAPPDRAIGYWVAALREAFEEVGLLLAYDPGGTPLVEDGAVQKRLADHRARCAADAAAFRAMLEAETLTLATDRMAYLAHWITPEARPVRYDTRFFVAAAFPDAAPEPDGVEAVGARWLTASGALAEQAAGRLVLPFVTRRILASVAAYPSVAALLEGVRALAVRRVMPRIVVAGGEERFLLPGDAGYG
ncbi:MAG: NUDIX hydrolase [Candidatus Rokuibacteriota bacterium]